MILESSTDDINAETSLKSSASGASLVCHLSQRLDNKHNIQPSIFLSILRQSASCRAPMQMEKTAVDKHFRPKLGQKIKSDDRYTVLRKLGDGITATTWLVQDSLAE